MKHPPITNHFSIAFYFKLTIHVKIKGVKTFLYWFLVILRSLREVVAHYVSVFSSHQTEILLGHTALCFAQATVRDDGIMRADGFFEYVEFFVFL